MDVMGQRDLNFRNEKSYSGELMRKGTQNENIILKWLEHSLKAKTIVDFREFRLAQRIDVDFGIETINGDYVLGEIKSDRWIRRKGNLLFEFLRINHFWINHWNYTGWGFRSPAQKLIIRNPHTNGTFIFDFLELRTFVGKYIAEMGKQIRIDIVLTDTQKTTFNFLIPFKKIREYGVKYKFCRVFDEWIGYDTLANKKTGTN